VEKNHKLWVQTPEFMTGSLRMTYWVSKDGYPPHSRVVEQNQYNTKKMKRVYIYLSIERERERERETL